VATNGTTRPQRMGGWYGGGFTCTIRLPARATDIASANLLLAGEEPRHARGPASAPMKILLLSNPVSGGGHAAAMAGRLAERLVSAGHEVCSEPTRLEPPETWLDALAA